MQTTSEPVEVTETVVVQVRAPGADLARRADEGDAAYAGRLLRELHAARRREDVAAEALRALRRSLSDDAGARAFRGAGGR